MEPVDTKENTIINPKGGLKDSIQEVGDIVQNLAKTQFPCDEINVQEHPKKPWR